MSDIKVPAKYVDLSEDGRLTHIGGVIRGTFNIPQSSMVEDWWIKDNRVGKVDVKMRMKTPTTLSLHIEYTTYIGHWTQFSRWLKRVMSIFKR